MARTNIDIDEDLVRLVMQQKHLKTKREAVDYALRQVAVVPYTIEEILNDTEPIEFDEEYLAWRSSHRDEIEEI